MDRRRFLAAGIGLVPVIQDLSATGAEGKGSIRIVSSLPRTGGSKKPTDSIVNAIRLAIEEFPGKDAGIEYLDWDDSLGGSWRPELEAKNAHRAVADADVMAFIGPYNSGAAMISMPILNQAGLVQVAPSTTYPGLTKKTDSTSPNEPTVYRPAKKVTFCRVCPTDEQQGAMAAGFVKDELKVKRVYVLDDKELYGQSVASDFAARCKELEIEVLGHESINHRQQEFLGLMKAISKRNPDLVYFGGTTQSGGPAIARDMVAAGLKGPLIVPDGCYEEAFIRSAGPNNLNGRSYATIGGVVPSQLVGKGAEFVKAYRARYRDEPDSYAVYGYEAAFVVLSAIKSVGKKDREAIRKAVVGTRDFDGALGKWSFDASGDTTLQQLTVSKVEKGKFVPIKVMTRKVKK